MSDVLEDLQKRLGVTDADLSGRTPTGQGSADLLGQIKSAAGDLVGGGPGSEKYARELGDYQKRLKAFRESNPGLWDKFWNTPQAPSEASLLRNYNRVSGGAATALNKAILALAGKDLPPGTVEQTIAGKYPGSMDVLERSGINPWVAALAGFAIDVASDPIGGAQQAVKGLAPMASLLKKAGRKVYGLPFAKAEAEISSRFKHQLPKGLFADQLFEAEIGGFGRANEEIGRDITKLRQQRGTEIGSLLKSAGDEGIDLAPKLDETLAEFKSTLDPEGKDASTPLQFFKRILGGEKHEREQALALLQSQDVLHPELRKWAEKIGGGLSQAETKAPTLGLFSDLLDNLSEGRRTAEGLQDWKIAAQQKAAKSEAMQSSAYQRGATYNVGKHGEKEMATELGKALEGVVDERLGGETLSRYQQLKNKYAALRRGEMPAWRSIQQAEGRPVLSKADIGLGGGLGAMALSTGNPMYAIPPILAKGWQTLNYSPRVGTGVGLGLKNLSKSNVWDAYMRRLMVNNQE